jgi:Spy/CpxP family protein refolding chaperone
MQTTTQDATQTVPPSLLQSLLPYLLASVVLTALPLYVIAEDNPSGVPPAIACPYTPPTQNGVTPSMLMNMPFSPLPIAELDLTEQQQNMLFKLMHDNARAIFENEKVARKTMKELQQLTRSERFGVTKAKSLAEAHGKALAELAYLHTVFQAQIWTALSDKQRKRATRLMTPPQ